MCAAAKESGHTTAWVGRRIRVPLTGAGRVGRAQLLDHLCRLSLCATALGITSRPQIQLGILRCDPPLKHHLHTAQHVSMVPSESPSAVQATMPL